MLYIIEVLKTHSSALICFGYLLRVGLAPREIGIEIALSSKIFDRLSVSFSFSSIGVRLPLMSTPKCQLNGVKGFVVSLGPAMLRKFIGILHTAILGTIQIAIQSQGDRETTLISSSSSRYFGRQKTRGI